MKVNAEKDARRIKVSAVGSRLSDNNPYLIKIIEMFADGAPRTRPTLVAAGFENGTVADVHRIFSLQSVQSGIKKILKERKQEEEKTPLTHIRRNLREAADVAALYLAELTEPKRCDPDDAESEKVILALPKDINQAVRASVDANMKLAQFEGYLDSDVGANLAAATIVIGGEPVSEEQWEETHVEGDSLG